MCVFVCICPILNVFILIYNIAGNVCSKYQIIMYALY